MLVVQTRTQVQGMPPQVLARVRAAVRKLRKRIQGQDNGEQVMNGKVKEIMDKEKCCERTAYRRIVNVSKKSDSDEVKDGYNYSKGQWV